MLGVRSVPVSPRYQVKTKKAGDGGRKSDRLPASQLPSRQTSPTRFSPQLLRSPAENKAFVESLVRRHKQALNQLVHLRKRKLAEELKEMQSIPTISRRSQVLIQFPRKAKDPARVRKPKEVEIKLERSRDMEISVSPRQKPPLLEEKQTGYRPRAEAESVYLSDLLAMKTFVDRDLSQTSSVSYQANPLPEHELKVRLPFDP